MTTVLNLLHLLLLAGGKKTKTAKVVFDENDSDFSYGGQSFDDLLNDDLD